MSKIPTLYSDYQECILDLDIYGKIVSTPQQSIEELTNALFEEFKRRKPMPTLEYKRYELSRLVSPDYRIIYNKELELQDNESLVELRNSQSSYESINFEDLSPLIPEVQEAFSYEMNITDSVRQSIIEKYDLETGEEFKPGIRQTENIVGTVEEDTSLRLSDESIEKLGVDDEGEIALDINENYEPDDEEEEFDYDSYSDEEEITDSEEEEEEFDYDSYSDEDESEEEEFDYDSYSDDEEEIDNSDEEEVNDSDGEEEEFDYDSYLDEDSDEEEIADSEEEVDDYSSYSDDDEEEEIDEYNSYSDEDEEEEFDYNSYSDEDEEVADSEDEIDDYSSYSDEDEEEVDDSEDEEEEEFDYDSYSDDEEDVDDYSSYSDESESEDEDEVDDYSSYSSDEEEEEEVDDYDSYSSKDEDDEEIDDYSSYSLDDEDEEEEVDDHSFDYSDDTNSDSLGTTNIKCDQSQGAEQFGVDDYSSNSSDGVNNDSLGTTNNECSQSQSAEQLGVDEPDFSPYEEPVAKVRVKIPVTPAQIHNDVSQPEVVDRSAEPTDIRAFLRKYPRCEYNFALNYFTKKQINDAIKIGKIIKKGNILKII